jgi:hypothetical protein
MIVVTSCLRATYATGRFVPGLLAILLNLPVFRRLGRGIAVVTEKYTETPSGLRTLFRPGSWRHVGAASVPSPREASPAR